MLLIFDCDGVLVDSEHLACMIDADYLTSLGIPFTAEESARRFIGMSLKDMRADLAREFGDRVPADFSDQLTRRTLERFAIELLPIDGARDAILSLAQPRCVASSSTPERIAASLATAKLIDLFDDKIYSSTMVARGKPAPDIFFHAAKEMACEPRDCVVIEDSLHGVAGATAAYMRVIGFVGGTHIADKRAHAEKLRNAGAHVVIHHMRELGGAIDQIAR